MTGGRSTIAAVGFAGLVIAALAGCAQGTTHVSAAGPGAAPSPTTTVLLPSAPTPVAAPGVPGPSQVPTGVTLVPQPLPQDGVYQAGIPIHIDWGGLQASVEGLAACSVRDAKCDVRSRFMPGFTGGTNVPVTLEVADLDALVSVRVESVSTGAVLVDQANQPGTPRFTSPREPGDYLVGIDLTGTARTLSYAFLVRESAQPPAYDHTARTFPVNAATG